MTRCQGGCKAMDLGNNIKLAVKYVENSLQEQ